MYVQKNTNNLLLLLFFFFFFSLKILRKRCLYFLVASNWSFQFKRIFLFNDYLATQHFWCTQNILAGKTELESWSCGIGIQTTFNWWEVEIWHWVACQCWQQESTKNLYPKGQWSWKKLHSGISSFMGSKYKYQAHLLC